MGGGGSYVCSDILKFCISGPAQTLAILALTEKPCIFYNLDYSAHIRLTVPYNKHGPDPLL